jgi:hypothetical protein
MFLVYLAMELHPFGNGTVLVLDLNGQYVYFHEALRDFVYGDNSLLYSFLRGLGGEFIGIYAYYLASPLSYLVALFPVSAIQEAMLCIILLKVGLCGLTFGYYMHKNRYLGNTATIIFSTIYALTAYAVVMQHNTMWIDNVYLLPLIVLGVESLIKYKKFALFTASLALALFSRPILSIIFPSQHEAVELCAPLLSMLGGSVLFSCLITTTNALLQSYRRQSLPIVSMSLGVAVKLVSTYALVRVADIGVMGAPIGSLLCNITVSYMNLYFLWKHSALRLNAWGTLFKPLIASTFSLGVGFALYRFLLALTDGMLLPFSAAACSSVILYITVSVLIGCITEEDIRLLPLGARIINIKKDKNKTA